MAGENLSLGEAATRFLVSLPPQEGKVSQRQVYGFVRWYGWERPVSGLTAAEVAHFAERLSSSNADYEKKVDSIRAFLTHAKKEGWSKTNLSVHLKAKKAKTRLPIPSRRVASQKVSLTPQGYAALKAELEELKKRHLQAIEEIRRAAADKDFRENAPLEAAREQHGQLQGRITELEEILKSAVIIDEQPKSALKVAVGDAVLLQDTVSGEELRYTVVSPREVDPSRGKISSASPLGKAVIGRGEGEMVEIAAPAGKLRYQIKRIER